MTKISDKEIEALNQYILSLKVKKVSSNTYTGLNNSKKKELQIFLKSDYSLDELFINKNGVLAKGLDNELMLKVPIYEGELKYFYATYKDYYYIPSEDYALHSSIAVNISPADKEKAKPDNCYTRKTSAYLPMWDHMAEPFYKKDYRSKELFFEITDEVKRDQHFFTVYAKHIINMLIK